MTHTRPDALHAVPVELTHFVGRERELETLRALAATARLLTLTGAGGSGKSRLALELVRQQAPRPGGVVWVELAPLMDESLLAGAILRALGTPSEGGAATVGTISATIGSRSLTLVLDNCEHLVATCAEIADALLRSCPNLGIIATSREALGVAGERAWLVPPLTLPAADAGADALAASDAVRLFVDRAQDVLPSFGVTAHNARAIADICTRLDGIPLAIELAAVRVRHLSPEQIRDRLHDAFSLLTTGSRTALPRHRTLRAALDWSHDLLPPDARVVLRRLSVFRGGFTIDMVERAASGGGIAPDAVLDLIGVLVDRSLITVREENGSARYHLLETTRQYSLQRLEESGEATEVRRRFARAVIEFVGAAEPEFTTRARKAAFARVEPELDNIREALSYTRRAEPEAHIRLVGMLWWFWFSTRHWVEAHEWITGALALPAAAPPTRERAALLFALGALGALRGSTDEARAQLEESAALAASVGDARLEAYSLNYIGMTYSASLSPEAREYTRRAERWMRANGDDYGLRLSLLLGGMAEYGAGDTAAAKATMEEAVQIARRFGHDRELAVALQTYATILLGMGEAERAHVMVRESLHALRRDPSFLFIARAIDHHAQVHAVHDPARAAREIGIAAAIRRHIGANRFQHDEARMAGVIARLREALGDDAFERALADGARVPPAAAIDEVLRDNEDDAASAASPTAASAVPAPAATDPSSALTGARAVTASPPDLAVRTLGPFEVRVQGARVESWPYARPKELLAYLLVHPQGSTRAEIGAALWPDAAPSQVRNSFHVTMHHLRRALGHAEWIVTNGERYTIAPGVTVELDADVFRERVQAAPGMSGAAGIAALTDAMRLYGGHFLAGETVESWRDDVQDRLRRMFCDAGMRLGALHEAAGDDDAAAAAYEAVAACEPLHEAAHRGLLLTLTRSGRRAHAVRHFERLRTLLRDLDLDPEEETIELYERIRGADIVPGPPG